MKLEADLHTHTIASGHSYSTLREMARMAGIRGLKALAVTDHGPAMPGAPHYYHFTNQRSLPDRIEGVRVLRGVEANIVDARGRLDLTDESLGTLDFVIAGFHAEAGYAGGSMRENTASLLAAMANPWVDMIAHPCDRRFPVDLPAVAAAARRYGVILEINNRSFAGFLNGIRDSREACLTLAGLAKAERAPIALSSDAHFDEEIGLVDAAARIADEAGLSRREIINLNAERLLAHLHNRKRLAAARRVS